MNKTFLLLAWRGLGRNWKRTIFTVAAFVIGFTGLAVLDGYILRVERVLRTGTLYESMHGHIQIEKKGAIDFWKDPEKFVITKEQLLLLKKIIPETLGPRLDFLSEKIKTGAQLNVDNKSIPVLVEGIPVDAEKKARTHSDLQKWFFTFFNYHPKPFITLPRNPEGGSAADSLVDSVGGSVTPEVARKFGFKVQSEKDPIFFEAQLVGLDFSSNLNAVDLSVNKLHMSGSDFGKDLSVEAPIELIRQLVQSEGASEFNIFLKDLSEVKKAVESVKGLLAQYPALADLQALPFDTEEVSPQYFGNMGILRVIMFFFLCLIGGSVVLSVLNVLTMSIKERSLEIGTFLSLGFSSSTITLLFLYEALIIGFLGSLLGMILSQIAAFIINRCAIHFVPPGALGIAQVFIDLTLEDQLKLALSLMTLLILASFQLIRSQTKEKITYLLYSSEAQS